MLSLYIHIPFCVKKCLYCDFVSFAGIENQIDNYLTALEAEMQVYKGLCFDTVFIGGGTPTHLSTDQLNRLLKSIHKHFSLKPDYEFTVECNPGTVSFEKLKAIKENGVNRLSFGAQAKDPTLLKTIGRIHLWQDVETSIALAKQAGFTNLSIDLMYGLPGQTKNDLTDAVEAFLKLEIAHLSLYSLIVEEGTPLIEKLNKKELTLPTEDELYNMQTAARGILQINGYTRYEISNFAKDGKISRHNMAYWLRTDYLGLGLNSHSFLNNVRFYNTSDLTSYLSGKYKEGEEIIKKQDALYETIMLNTRTNRGIDINAFNNEFGVDLLNDGKTPQMLINKGLAQINNGRFILTNSGMDVQNSIIIELVKPYE